jgi:hypothetical protein
MFMNIGMNIMPLEARSSLYSFNLMPTVIPTMMAVRISEVKENLVLLVTGF